MRRTVRSLLGEGAAVPERVAESLSRALARILCSQRHGRSPPCSDCDMVGRLLVPPIGRALLLTAQRGEPRCLIAADYEIVGRVLERIESEAGMLASIGVRR